jgi:hypothetical protein
MNVSVASSNEPDFLKVFSNATVCTWFYILFVINAVVAFVAIISAIYLSLVLKVNVAYKLAYFVGYSLAIAVPLINATFYYILCERALPSTKRYL